jgi:hypothetical protein
MDTVPAFRNSGEALGMAKSAIRYLADLEVTGLPTETMAEILQGMEEIDAGQAAVRGRTVWAFTTSQAYHEYAQRGMVRWLVTET